MAKVKVLIVDDERLLRWSLRQKCEEWGYQVFDAENGAEALALAQSESPDVILLDVRLPGISGLEVLEKLKVNGDSAAVIMITADPQIDDVKAALRMGAYDYVGKPLDFDGLCVAIQNALEAHRLRGEVEVLRGEVRRQTGSYEVVGAAKKTVELMRFVRKVAASETSTILVQGESGTGKDLIAKVLHYESSRRDGPFVAINCSAIPETLIEAELFGHEKGAFTDAKAMKKGLFEVAHSGTLFLDEIGELSPFLQAKLLRVLEDQVIRRVGGVRDIQVDVRVVAASNRDLERAVREGHFRQDLYYRLAVISIYIPPLRERKEDILPLVDFFIQDYNRKFRKSVRGLSEETSRLLLAYEWPGNVRELRNAVERAMILEEGSVLRPNYLPFSVTQPHSGVTAFERASSPLAGESLSGGRRLPSLTIPEGGTSLEEIERSMVVLALEQSHGNQTQASRLLDISRDALRYKMKKFGLIHTDEEEEAATSG
ncbi:MAG TPA: sigma-54 dependent transcriptional regulator [Candidatus Dormibacteraeota bacterium]|nr:sigma-54 dependent transcriptional regulator [Candidatus Dormibacteraeota bacterium]